MLIYCDSVILIYYLDATGSFHIRARNRLMALCAAGDQIAISDLTRLECRVRPVRLGDVIGLARYDNFFTLPDVCRVPLTTAVFDRATNVRALYGYKTADAIHLAAAVEAACDVFLTNDTRLSGFPDLRVEVLP